MNYKFLLNYGFHQSEQGLAQKKDRVRVRGASPGGQPPAQTVPADAEDDEEDEGGEEYGPDDGRDERENGDRVRPPFLVLS